MCHINPKVDFAFKKLFGSEENQNLLISLLNAILTLAPPIIEVELRNPYNLTDYRAGKLSILDIKAKAAGSMLKCQSAKTSISTSALFITGSN